MRERLRACSTAPARNRAGGAGPVQARRQLAQAVHRTFSDDLAVLRTDLQRCVAAQPGTVQAATMAERRTADKRLKERAQIYADLLGMQQEGIQAQIAALTDQARAVIADDPAPAATTPPDAAA